MPDFFYEDKHDGIVCGVDEVGRGPLAGPVVAAAVIIPQDVRNMGFIKELTDSKKLSKTKLEVLNTLIHEHCHLSIIELPPVEIDRLNILQASLKAMKQAIKGLSSPSPTHALIDGNRCPIGLPCSSEFIVKGDLKSTSIAAASIIAKVHRDHIMKDLAERYPHYGWERNSGYPSKEHRAAIDEYGITEFHRKSFAPVRNYLEFGTTSPQRLSAA